MTAMLTKKDINKTIILAPIKRICINKGVLLLLLLFVIHIMSILSISHINGQLSQPFTLTPPLPLIDVPFNADVNSLPIGTRIFATKESVCLDKSALSGICTVSNNKTCTFTITRSSLKLQIQDDNVQRLSWCIAGQSSPLSSFDLHAVSYNPRYYTYTQPWNVTFTSALPLGSEVGISTSEDCSSIRQMENITSDERKLTLQPTVTIPYYICARIRTVTGELTKTIPVNVGIFTGGFLSPINWAIRYNFITLQVEELFKSFSLSTSKDCRNFAQPFAPLNQRVNITAPSGVYYMCAIEKSTTVSRFNISVPSQITFTVRDYSVNPVILYELRSTEITLSEDAIEDNMQVALYHALDETLVADWSSSPMWSLRRGVYNAWTKNTTGVETTWFSRSIMVVPTPLISIEPSLLKLGLSARVTIDRSNMLPPGFITASLQTQSGLVVATNATSTDTMYLFVTPLAQSQELLYYISVPYNTTCPKAQYDDAENDNINCQPYSYTIGSVKAEPYYLQYTPLITLRQVNFTLDRTVLLRSGATIKFVLMPNECTSEAIKPSLQVVLTDSSTTSVTIPQFPSSGNWRFCVNEFGSDSNGFKPVLPLTINKPASLTPSSFIPGLVTTVIVADTPANTPVYITKSNICNSNTGSSSSDSNVIANAISNATGVAVLSFTLSESNVLLTCVRYDGGVESGTAQTRVISIGSITPSTLTFTPNSLINKHETQVDFDVASESQLSSGQASAYITSATSCSASAAASSILSQSPINAADNVLYTKPYARFTLDNAAIIVGSRYNMCVCYSNTCVLAGSVNVIDEMNLITVPETATAGLPVLVRLTGTTFNIFSPNLFVVIPVTSNNNNGNADNDRCAQYRDGTIREYVKGSIDSNGQTSQSFTLPVTVERAVMCVRNNNNNAMASFMYGGTITLSPFTSLSRFVQIGLTNVLRTSPDVVSTTASVYLIPYNGVTPVNPDQGRMLCCDSLQRYYTSRTQRLDNNTPAGSYILCESVPSSSASSSASCNNNDVVSSANILYAVTPWSLTLPNTPIRQHVTFTAQLSGGSMNNNRINSLMMFANDDNDANNESVQELYEQEEQGTVEEEERQSLHDTDVAIMQDAIQINNEMSKSALLQYITPFAAALADINSPYKLVVIPSSTTAGCENYNSSGMAEEFTFTSTLSAAVTITKIEPMSNITFCLLPSDNDFITLQEVPLQPYMSPSTIVSYVSTRITPGNSGISGQSQAKLSYHADCSGSVSNTAPWVSQGNYYNLTLDACADDVIASVYEVYFCENNNSIESSKFMNMGKISILRQSACPNRDNSAPASITNVQLAPASPITSFGINTSLLTLPFLSQSPTCATCFADNATLSRYGYSPELNEDARFYVCARIRASPLTLFTTSAPTFQFSNWQINPSTVLSRYNSTMGKLPDATLQISQAVPLWSQPFISLSMYCTTTFMSAAAFTTPDATLAFATTAINGMAYVCLRSTAPSIANRNVTPTSSGPVAIAQFLIVTPPFVSFVNQVLFKDVPFYVKFDLNPYGLNSNPLYSMIAGADANYTYHELYVTSNRRVFFALQSNCVDNVVSDKVNVSANNTAVIPTVFNPAAFTQDAIALCAETAAGVTFLRNVTVVTSNVYPTTVVTGLQTTLYMPHYIGKNFRFSAVSNNCDNIDKQMPFFTTNATGYAQVLLRRNDGSSALFGIYTLCVGKVTLDSAGNMIEEFNNPINRITLYPLLRYGVSGHTLVVSVPATIFLQGDLTVDKLESGFALQPDDCASRRQTINYGTWTRVGNYTDRIAVTPTKVIDHVYLCARVFENNTIVPVMGQATSGINSMNINSGALRFVHNTVVFPTTPLDVCATAHLDRCQLPGIEVVDGSSSSSSAATTTDNNNNNNNQGGSIGVIYGDCCNAADRVNQIGYAAVNSNSNQVCELKWNRSLYHQLPANTTLSVCAWHGSDVNYCATLKYINVGSSCGNGENNANANLIPSNKKKATSSVWAIAVVVVLVLLLVSLVIVVAILHYCCGYISWQRKSERESKPEHNHDEPCLEHGSLSSEPKKEIEINSGVVEESTLFSSNLLSDEKPTNVNPLRTVSSQNNTENNLSNILLQNKNTNNQINNINNNDDDNDNEKEKDCGVPNYSIFDDRNDLRSYQNTSLQATTDNSNNNNNNNNTQSRIRRMNSKGRNSMEHSSNIKEIVSKSFLESKNKYVDVDVDAPQQKDYTSWGSEWTSESSISTLQSELEASIPGILVRRSTQNRLIPEINATLAHLRHQGETCKSHDEHNDDDDDNNNSNEQTELHKKQQQEQQSEQWLQKSKKSEEGKALTNIDNNNTNTVKQQREEEEEESEEQEKRKKKSSKKCKSSNKGHNNNNNNKNDEGQYINVLSNKRVMKKKNNNNGGADSNSNFFSDEDIIVEFYDVTGINTNNTILSANNNGQEIASLLSSSSSNNNNNININNKCNDMKDKPITLTSNDSPSHRASYPRRVSFVEEKEDTSVNEVQISPFRIKRTSFSDNYEEKAELVNNVQTVLGNKAKGTRQGSVTNPLADNVAFKDAVTVDACITTQIV